MARRVIFADGDAVVAAELQKMPNIGPAMASDFIRLGIRSADQLAQWRDGATVYDALCELDGVRHDPCVLDTFEAAVDFAKGGPPRPWWEYSRERKARAAKAAS